LLVGLSSLVRPNSVRDATYRAVFAALRIAIIKHPVRNPGKSGLLAFNIAMTTIALVWVVFVEGAIVRLPWAIRFGTLSRNGSVQLPFR
jgi:hypothetical protein